MTEWGVQVQHLIELIERWRAKETPDLDSYPKSAVEAICDDLAALVAASVPQSQPKAPAACLEVGSKFAMTGERDLLNTIDGKVWADEFCRITGFHDAGWALAWFCNAIMTGFDEGARRAKTALPEPSLVAPAEHKHDA